MLDRLTSADWKPYLDQPFRITPHGSPPLEAVLIEVRDLGRLAEDDSTRRPFSILFRGPTEPVVPQQICRVEHPQMGALDLFTVPVGSDREGMLYEAIFA